MRLGLHLPQLGRAASPGTIVDIAQRAEEMGFTDLWASDHVAVPTTLAGTPSFFPEPVPLLSLAAAHTSRVALGTSVVIAAYRNPMHFAKQWATLDWLAPGRTVLGVGAGWLDEEFAACGVDPRRKGRRLDDYIAGWRTLWGGGTEFESEFFSFRDVRVRPEPQQPDPGVGRRLVGRRHRPRGSATTAGTRPGRRSKSSPVTWNACTPRSTAPVATAARSRCRCTSRCASASSCRRATGRARATATASATSPTARRDGLLATLGRYAALGVEHVLLTPQCRSRQEWDGQLDALEGFPAEMAAR